MATATANRCKQHQQQQSSARTASWCRTDYILPLWFFLFSFFSTPNHWCHWTDLNQTWSQTCTHIYLYLLFEKLVRSPSGVYPPQVGGKKTLFVAFWDRLWNLTEHISATERDINNRKETWQSTGTPLHALQMWWTETAENGWRVSAYHLNFRIERHCQPYRMDVNNW